MWEKFWLLTVEMGYGHERASYALEEWAYEGIIVANKDPQIPFLERKIWEIAKEIYFFFSRASDLPIVGKYIFSLFDKFQKIPPLDTTSSLEEPSEVLKWTYSLFKLGWGKGLVKKCKKNEKVPILSTFPILAFMAEYFGFGNDIFCLVCDTDVTRLWAPLKPRGSKIKYFVPHQKAGERLIRYGVKKENIYLTGFPLPKQNLGSPHLEILKEDFHLRMKRLDPEDEIISKNQHLIEGYSLNPMPLSNDPITILFSFGGAGAQKAIAKEILLRSQSVIPQKKIRFIFAIGQNEKLFKWILRVIHNLKLEGFLGTFIELIFEIDFEEYFKKFNNALKYSDILWTKPSELCFYAGLGIPLFLSNPLGSHELSNLKFVVENGCGILIEDMRDFPSFLFKLHETKALAQMALNGFLRIEKRGVFQIPKIMRGENEGYI